MKKTRFLLSGLIILLTLNLSAQTKSYEFRTSPVGKKEQATVGNNFYYVSFNIKYVKNDMQKESLIQFLTKNPNFKKVQINSANEFHGFINKKLNAKDVREILLSQNTDFKFDRYKFKGCYRNEELKQYIKDKK